MIFLLALSPLVAMGACTGDDTLVDGGADAGKDATTDTKADGTVDATTEAGFDATTETGAEGGAEGGADAEAGTDAAGDAETEGGADAEVDGGADAETDASGDASADASDGGGASWHTPTCDGTVTSAEYGGTSNQTTSGSETWSMTWDATNLYVAVSAAAIAEGTVLYVGFSGNGIQTGQAYDGTDGTLPFLADAVVYAKHGYDEVRTADTDASAWSNPTAGAITFCDDGTNVREEVIPWSVLGAASIPSAFRFFGYATSATGFVYGQIPTSNPGGNVGTAATFNHDFYVTSTADGTGSFPFDLTE